MADDTNALAIALFSEILTADQLWRNRLSRVLPKGMANSHFSGLHLLVYAGNARSPAQPADPSHLTRSRLTTPLTTPARAGPIPLPVSKDRNR